MDHDGQCFLSAAQVAMAAGMNRNVHDNPCQQNSWKSCIWVVLFHSMGAREYVRAIAGRTENRRDCIPGKRNKCLCCFGLHLRLHYWGSPAVMVGLTNGTKNREGWHMVLSEPRDLAKNKVLRCIKGVCVCFVSQTPVSMWARWENKMLGQLLIGFPGLWFCACLFIE